MKRYITCTVTALFATMLLAVAGSEKETIKANETAAWQAYKDKNADAFKKVVDKDIRCVYSDGVSNFQKEMDNMKKWAVKSFTIGDFDSFSDEKDVIVTTYTVKLDATADGKDISGTYNAGSVWKKEGNDWLAIFHTNMKQESATK